jgi:hypothetical protein
MYYILRVVSKFNDFGLMHVFDWLVIFFSYGCVQELYTSFGSVSRHIRKLRQSLIINFGQQNIYYMCHISNFGQ